MPAKKMLTIRQRAIAAGYRSGLEEKTANDLRDRGVPFEYETKTVHYIRPARASRYTPDFILPNGIIIETKGRWVTDDRQKISLILDQHPNLDLRMVFSNPFSRISKASKTTYAMICNRRGIPYAKQVIPQSWIDEPTNPDAIAALADAGLKKEPPK